MLPFQGALQSTTPTQGAASLALGYVVLGFQPVFAQIRICIVQKSADAFDSVCPKRPAGRVVQEKLMTEPAAVV